MIISSTIYLRLFATASIVWFHIPDAPWRILAAPGMAVFLCLSLMHAAQPHALKPTCIRLSKRILLAWFVWWIFYAVVRLWLYRGTGQAWPNQWNLLTPLYWPWIHLWYLPFVYLGSIITQLASLALKPLRPRTKIAIFTLVGVLLTATSQSLGLRQFSMAMPSLGFGVAFGYCLRLPRQKRLIGFASVSFLGAASGWLFLSDSNATDAIAYIGGGILMMGCMLPMRRTRLATRLASMTLGVYLIHPFAMLLLWKLMGQGTPFFIMFPATLLLSLLLVAGMRKIPPLKTVV